MTVAAAKPAAKSKRTRKAPAKRSTKATFDPAKYGSIQTPPPRLYPCELDPVCPLPPETLSDPLGAGQKALDFLSTFKFSEGRRAGQPITDHLSAWQRATSCQSERGLGQSRLIRLPNNEELGR